jgi:eukaryotic-like serine/threonine-protein kinase
MPSSDELASRRVLRQANPEVSRGLEDILLKCLAPDPSARYSDAGQLAADLRRHLAGLPLGGVPNRSLKERWHKWRRRKPHALIVLAASFVALAVIVATAVWLHEDRLSAARLAIAQAHQHFASREFAAAIERAKAGRDAIRLFPWQSDLHRALSAQLTLATRAQLADALHELVEKLRFVDGFENTSDAKLRQLEIGCRKIWQVRGQIASVDGSAVSGEMETQLRADLLDLALLWSRLRVRLAGEDQVEQERRAALGILDDVQALCGNSTVLELARREYTLALDPGEASVASTALPAPRTAWEHYLVGRFMLQSEKLDEAQEEFEQALGLEPSAFWPNFYLTLCAYRLEDFEKALNAAYVCVALAPKSTECFYNRALCHQAAGHYEQSHSDFTRALKLDPTSSLAALHRGMLLAEMHRFPQAVADLKTALDLNASPPLVYYQMALVHAAAEDRAAAQACVERALEHDRAYAPALSLKSRLDSEQ